MTTLRNSSSNERRQERTNEGAFHLHRAFQVLLHAFDGITGSYYAFAAYLGGEGACIDSPSMAAYITTQAIFSTIFIRPGVAR